MDIQNILEQARQRGLQALDSIRQAVSPSTPQMPQRQATPMMSPYIPRSVMSTTQPQLFTPLRPASVIPTPELKAPEPIKIEPLKVKPLFEDKLPTKPYQDVLKPVVEIKTSPQPLTIEPKKFELPRPSEMIFGDWAKQANTFINNLPQTMLDNENKALESFKTDLQNKYNAEVAAGQENSIQAQRFQADIDRINNAINSNSFFYKNNLNRNLAQLYTTGSFVAGNVQTGANLWSAGISVFDQYTKSEEDKKKTQEANTVVQDGVTKFFDNVLKDLRPYEQNIPQQFIESVGGMAGMIYLSSIAGGAWLRTVVGTGLESISEGGATYDENRKKGMSIDEAFNRETAVIASNVVLNYITNRLSGVFEVNPQELKTLQKKILNVLGTAGIESIQEGSQTAISNLATDKPASQGVLEAMGFGFVIGGGIGTVKIRYNPTGETVAEVKVKPEVVQKLGEDASVLISNISGKPISIDSSIEEITSAYSLGINNALNLPNANSVIDSLNGAYQTLSTYKAAVDKVSLKSKIDPTGEMSDEEFAAEKTKRAVKDRKTIKGEDRAWYEKKYQELNDKFFMWVNNVETPGKLLRDVDEIKAKKLGRELKPTEKIDVYYDEQWQLENIFNNSEQVRGIKNIANKIFKLKLDIEEFGQYLISRRNLALYEAGIKPDVNVIEETRTVAGFEKKYAALAQEYYRVMDSLVKLTWQEGIISTETYNYILNNKDYAPFYKVFSEENAPTFNQVVKSKKVGLGRQTIFQKIESKETTTVENPFIMSVPHIFSAYRQILKNRTGVALIEAVKDGSVQDAGYTGYVVQSADDLRMRKFVRDQQPAVDNLVNKLTNKLRRQKKAFTKLQKEVIGLVQENYRFMSLTNDPEVDNKYVRKLTRKIETMLSKRDELLKDAEEIFQNILKTKQGGEDVLNDAKYINKTNRMLTKRVEWVNDLVEIGADLLGNKGKKIMQGNKAPSIKERRRFIKEASSSDVYNYIVNLYNLPDSDFKKLVNKAVNKNLKIKDVLQEIDDIRNAQITNTLVNELIQLPSAEIDRLYAKYGKTQKAIGSVFKELKTLTDARITNTAVNSLIKSTPQELEDIKKKLNRKYPIIESMIDEVNATQARLDEETGYAQKLKEIESELDTVKNSTNLSTIEAYKDGFVEKVVISKELAKTLEVVNNPETINFLFKWAQIGTQALKLSTVVFDPQAYARLFLYDQQYAALMSKAPFRTSVLNGGAFVPALITTLTSGPFARNVYKLAPKGADNMLKVWDEWMASGGSSSELFIGNKDNAEKWLKSGGKNKISISGVANFLAKGDQIAKFQIYTINKEMYLQQGYTEEDARRQAAYDSRNTLPNFQRRSDTLRMIDILLPFAAASVQGAAKFRNLIATNPQMAADRLMIPALFYALSMLWNLSTEERRKAWAGIQQRVKDTKLIIFTDYIDENGNPFYISFPVDQNIMNFMQGVRKSFEGMASADAGLFFNGLSPLFESIFGFRIPINEEGRKAYISGLTPSLRLLFEIPANYNYFLDREIVPQKYQGKKNYLQFDDKTSEFAKWYGKAFDASPFIVDHALKGFFGRLPTYLDGFVKKKEEGTLSPEESKQLNSVQNILEATVLVNNYGAEEQKIWEDKKQADLDKDEKNTLVQQALSSGNIEEAKRLADGQITKQQWLGIENAYQKETIAETLTGKEKAYFNMPKAYLESVKKTNPDEAAVIDKVIRMQESATKLPNIDTKGIKFLPSARGGGGGGLTLKKVSLPKTGGGRKVSIKAPKLAAPKKVKAAKPKKLKAIKMPKVKPLKKIKRF